MTASKSGRWRRRLGVVAAVMALAVATLTISNTFGWAGRVTWSELGQFNIGTFEGQFQKALPLGMPKSSAEAYLKREGIPFSDEGGATPYLEIFKPGVHRAFFLIPGDLSIHVEFDRDLKVSGIRFHLQYK